MTPGGPAHQEELDARPPEIESSEVDFFELRLAPPEVVPVAVLLVRAGVEEVHVAAGNARQRIESRSKSYDRELQRQPFKILKQRQRIA
jgi:hypothetical protein